MKRLIILTLLLASTPLFSQAGFDAQYETLRTSKKLTDSARLHRLFALDYDYGMATYPEWATWEGRHENDDKLTDNSLEAILKREKEGRRSYDVIMAINRAKLNDVDKLNYDLYRRSLERDKEGEIFEWYYTPITQLGGIHQDIPQLFEVMPTETVKDYENIIARMNAVPQAVRNDVELMRLGLEKGITPPRVTLRDVPGQVAALLVEDFTKSPILLPFVEMPAEMSESDRKRLRDAAEAAYVESVEPALRELHKFLEEEYVPAARESIGMSALPNGKAWYAFRVKGYTTTDMTPEEIHAFGQSEVKRIRAEMEKVVKESGFEGTLTEYENFLRTDSQFYYTTAEALLTGYRDICKRADPELAKLFGHLPRQPYGVIPIPDYMAKSQTTAYYNGGSWEAGRPGYFYANTYDLASRPKWEMQPLALHEAVPGHHLQISIAQELDELPRWRRDGGYTAYVEGWGLYAESLGEKMGFYTTPSDKYGQLSYQMWRAVRLVVDVGIHQLGWTRQQAIDFFAANSGKSLHDIEVEIDRYIVWPGQALAYKIGERKIVELRDYARAQLGERFDIRDFHDELLGDGALPLDVLETKMRAWVESIKNSK